MKNTSSGHGLLRTERGLRWHLENIERHVFLSKMAMMFSLSIFYGENTLFLHLELIQYSPCPSLKRRMHLSGEVVVMKFTQRYHNFPSELHYPSKGP